MTLIGVLGRQIAVQTIPTIGNGRFENMSKLAFNGSSTGNTSAPQWTAMIFQGLDVYLGAFPYAFLILFAIPFALLYIGTGSLKMPGIVGIVIALYGFAFLPAPVKVFCFICIILSVAATALGLFKE